MLVRLLLIRAVELVHQHLLLLHLRQAWLQGAKVLLSYAWHQRQRRRSELAEDLKQVGALDVPSFELFRPVTVDEVLGDREGTHVALGDITAQVADVSTVPQQVQAEERFQIGLLSAAADLAVQRTIDSWI